MPREIEIAFAGAAFRRRRRLVVPLITTDPDGFPRVALLTMAEVRAVSPLRLGVAVMAGSRTAINLVRRGMATILFLHRSVTASIQARARHGRVCRTDPRRRLFPLEVESVRLDRPAASEGEVALLSGPTFTGRDAGRLFSNELYAEIGRVAGA